MRRWGRADACAAESPWFLSRRGAAAVAACAWVGQREGSEQRLFCPRRCSVRNIEYSGSRWLSASSSASGAFSLSSRAGVDPCRAWDGDRAAPPGSRRAPSARGRLWTRGRGRPGPGGPLGPSGPACAPAPAAPLPAAPRRQRGARRRWAAERDLRCASSRRRSPALTSLKPRRPLPPLRPVLGSSAAEGRGWCAAEDDDCTVTGSGAGGGEMPRVWVS